MTGAQQALGPLLANHRAYWHGWGTEDAADGGVSLYRSGLDSAALNGVTGNAVPVPEAIAVARRRLDGVPWFWAVSEASRPGTAEQLLDAGATLRMTTPVMALEPARFRPARPPRVALDVERHRPGHLADRVEAYAAAMGIGSLDPARLVRVEEARRYPGNGLVRFDARIDGVVRGTAELLLTGSVGGVYLVATEEGFRGLGIASVLTAAAVEHALQAGAGAITLQASAQGVPVYRRLGFETVTELRSFSLPG